ncbi:hypothetical protein ElyMa_001557200 [Elysia marginata]|uniref:Lipoprotein-associated type-17 domain-containing protein n=1 Tax=Elysia marginata TaxID=1093978 RepID=A0AAV4JE22_9GAST|nr:hypothetical protein ElyMa_001557200 [Elysia marginata]
MCKGTATTVLTPVVAVISCGNKSTKKKFNFTSDLAKIVNAKSSKNATTLNSAVGSKVAGDTVTAADLGYTLPSNLTAGVTATYVVKTAYASGAIVVTVTLHKDGENSTTKDITISAFDFTSDLAKIVNAKSSKNATTLNSAVGSKVAGDTVTAADLGYTLPTDLSAGVTATYVVKTAYASGTIEVTVTLQKDGESDSKDITIKASDAS